MADSITKKVDVSIDSDFGEHSVSQILMKKRAKMQAKEQPWKLAHMVAEDDVPTTRSLHNKPWFRAESLDEAYEDNSGS